MENTRLTILSIIFYILFSIIITRLFFWQIVNGEKMAIIAEDQHFIVFEIPGGRGGILDSEKNPLVKSINGYLLYADLNNIKNNKEDIAVNLAKIITVNKKNTPDVLEKEKEYLKNQLSNKNAVWVPLSHKLSEETKQKIEQLKIEGLVFEKEETRFYPEGSMSAQLLGFVGKDINGNDNGYFGLEGYYNLQLKGKEGKKRQEKDAFGNPILFGEKDEIKSKNGRTLITSIDKYVQSICEEYLKEGIEAYGAKGGSVTVMNPFSGEILAMASFPSYDPSKFEDFNENLYTNPVIGETFEPGSIMKPIIMSMALLEDKVKPSSKCPSCQGPRQIGEYTIKTFNDQYRPGINMTDILVNSDNTGMVYVGELLGKRKLFDYLNKFGFGNLTGIDLEEEELGSIKPLDKWYPIDQATVTFGQGIAVTQIQMLRAFAVIANGGKLVKPYLVKKIIENNKEIDVEPKEKTNILKNDVSKVMAEMLVNVTNKSPLHFPRDSIKNLDKYKISAKSGTAQIPIAGHYDPNKTIGSVIGFAPSDNPKFLILVRLVEPTARPWGSDTAGPIFFKITKDLLTYYGINPEL